MYLYIKQLERAEELEIETSGVYKFACGFIERLGCPDSVPPEGRDGQLAAGRAPH